MKRGFPRPQTLVETTTPPSRRTAYQKKWLGISYPHPYTARADLISRLHYGRVFECITFKKCIVCGKHVKGNKVWTYRDGDRLTPDSGPFHEKCVKLTQALCPFVAVTKGRFAWQEEDWHVVGPLIRLSYVESGYGKQVDSTGT